MDTKMEAMVAALPAAPAPLQRVRHATRLMWSREACVVAALCAGVLTLHLATNGLYGFQRDELYYLDSARHLALGYVDYPPLTPLIARLSLALFGSSVWALRLWPSLAGAAIVVLAWLIARELGGGRRARLLAAVAAATSLVLLGANWLFQTVSFDQLAWVTCLWLLARLLRTHDRRLWLALGIAAGVGLETKYTIAALLLGIAVAVVATPLRRDLRTRWPWLGAAATLVITAPNLVWQVTNGWPSLTFILGHPGAQTSDFSPLSFLGDQVWLLGPVGLVLWVIGDRWLLRSAQHRALGITVLVSFCVFLFIGKGYYVGPLHPVVLAAAACAVDARVHRRANAIRSWGLALSLQALVLLPLALPAMPESVMADSLLPQLRTDFADTVGWPSLVVGVDSVYQRVPPDKRASTVIIAANYGEAGAVNTYGPRLGLPDAHSGELSYYYWPPPALAGPVIVVGYDQAFAARLFTGCAVRATISNPFGLHNQEFSEPVLLCSGSRFPLSEVWPELRSFT